MQTVKESLTQLLIGHAVLKNMVRHDQDTVTDGHDGPLVPSPGSKPDRLKPVTPTGTSLLMLLHHLFSRQGTRTVELRRLLADLFWKFLGYKSEDAVRTVLREANTAWV